MFELLKDNPALTSFFTSDTLTRILISAAYLLAGLILIRLAIFVVRRITANKVSPQFRMIVDKIITYTGMTVLIMVVLAELGVNLAAILGAAGVLGIAVGVASQKSLGNMVSGLFLLSEKNFEIGDVISVNNTTGVVQDVDMLALKIRTFDNKLIRIPNETIISNIVTNITRYPLRRLDFEFAVSYGEDLNKVEEILLEVARSNPLILDEPEPLFLVKTFERHGVELLFGMWFLKNDFVQAKNSSSRSILDSLAAAGIRIPPTRISVNGASGLEQPAVPGNDAPSPGENS